jgi:hypothetical protein
MRTETITKTYCKYDELPDDVKDTAIEKLWDINVDYEWWDSTYDDAARIGLKITSFDIDRASYCNGDFKNSPLETANAILKEHGAETPTYILADDFIKAREILVDEAPRDADGEFEDESALDEKLDDLEVEFERAIRDEYLSILRKEYEFLTSRAAIIETIRANDYEFDEEGRLV